MKFLGQYKPLETPTVCMVLCTAQSVRLTDPTLTSRGCVREGIGTVGTKTDRKLDLEVGSSCVEAHGPRWEDKLAEGGDIQKNYGMNKSGEQTQNSESPLGALPKSDMEPEVSSLFDLCHHVIAGYFLCLGHRMQPGV